MTHADWPADVRATTCATPCTDPTHQLCPARTDGETHHLATRSGGKGTREQFCAHCHRSAADIRAGAADG